MSERQGTSPWVWIGCGCLGMAVLIVASVAGLFYVGSRMARDFATSMEDPAAQQPRALAVLGADRLPDGYHPLVAMTIPFIVKLAILSDEEPGADGRVERFGERGYIYLDFLRLGNQEELLDFFEGRTDDPRVLRRQNINLRLEEQLARGEIEREDVKVLWVAHRGEVTLSTGSGEGITTMLLFECEKDRRQRLGIWFGPDPDPEAAAEALDLAGTNADPAAITGFLEPFRPCG